MKDAIDKLSTYNLFNYLFPGILFVILGQQLTSYEFAISDNIFLNAFVYYFIGMIISRFGSILIEPLLIAIRFLNFSEYKRFVEACRKDEKIALFVEVSNMYRTLLSMLVLLPLLKLYNYLEMQFCIQAECKIYILIVVLLITFLFSYRKQTNYITKRVEANL